MVNQNAQERRNEPTELTPLNELNSQGLKVEPALPTASRMDATTKRFLIKITIDVVLLACGKFDRTTK